MDEGDETREYDVEVGVDMKHAARQSRGFVWESSKVLLQAGIIAMVIMIFVAQSHVVDGQSMESTLFHGQRLMVDKLSYRFTEPKRGEIIVFRNPMDLRERYVKRVIGIPGDTIEIRDNIVYLNGVALDESYIKEPMSWRMPSVTVRPGHVFVMGDNRNESLDSRDPRIGQIPYKLIVGRALFLYWPMNRITWFRLPESLAGTAM